VQSFISWQLLRDGLRIRQVAPSQKNGLVRSSAKLGGNGFPGGPGPTYDTESNRVVHESYRSRRSFNSIAATASLLSR
jgi:hypothetical protein